MILFKKKEEDKLDYKIGYKIFGDIFTNKKEKSILFLILWFVFLSFVILFITESFKYKKSENVYVEPSILIQNLNNGYKYDLTINSNNNYKYYTGEVNNNVDIGIKKENNVDIDYKIINDITYDNNGNIIDYPYDDLSLKILKYLNNFESSYLENDLMVYKYNIKYNNTNILVTLKTTYDKIVLIKYNYLENEYIINYY